MSSVLNPLCPNCGAALPPRGSYAVYRCSFCQHQFEVDSAAPREGHGPPLTERTTSTEFPGLVAEAERLMENAVRAHAKLGAEAANLGGTTALLYKAASKKLEQTTGTTRKAIAERDEATLRDGVDKLRALERLNAG
jgi:hypothetical protein